MGLCGRYYERMNVPNGAQLAILGNRSSSSPYTMSGFVPFLWQKRVAPTVGYSDLAHFDIIGVGGDAVTSIAGQTLTNGHGLNVVVTAGTLAARDACTFGSKDAACYIEYDAEL